MATAIGIGDLADRSVHMDQCVATLRRALDAGLNVVDTAPSYENGYSEEIVGAALRGRRQGVFVIDKVDHHDQPVGPQVEQSLRRLGLEQVDLMVFHGLSTMAGWARATAAGGLFEQLRRCVAAGQVRFVGISSHNPDVLREAVNSSLCDVVMFAIGPFADPRYEGEILPMARRQNVGTVCFKTFGSGKLLGDTSGYGRPLAPRPRGKFSSGGSDLAGEPRLPRLTVRQCVQYTLTIDPDVALLGMSFPNEQDAVLAAAAEFRPLSAGQLDATRRQAGLAVQGKGPCWWNPNP